MNIKNLEFLKESLKYLGFADKLNVEMENKIKEQPAEFKLTMAGEFNKNSTKDRIDFTLDFKKSEQTDMYFLNRYQAVLKNEDSAKERSQTFYVTKGSGITAKEAFNLLSGRSVNKDLYNKEGQPFNAWLQLDFQEKDKNDNFKVKQYHQGYGYDLAVALTRYPIKELGSEEDRAKLHKSLEKGNVQQVTFIKEGREDRMFVEANPQYKNLNVYDDRMQKVFQGLERNDNRRAQETPKEPEKAKERKESQKQESDDEGEGKKQRKSRKGRGVGV